MSDSGFNCVPRKFEIRIPKFNLVQGVGFEPT